MYSKQNFATFEIRDAASNHKTTRRKSGFTDINCTHNNHIPKVITPGLAAFIELSSSNIKDGKEKTADYVINSAAESGIKSSENSDNQNDFEENSYSVSFENDANSEVFWSEISGSSVRDLVNFFENYFDSQQEKQSNDKFHKKTKCVDIGEVVSSGKRKISPGSLTAFKKMNASRKTTNISSENTLVSPAERTEQVAEPPILELTSTVDSSCTGFLRRPDIRASDLSSNSKKIYPREHVFIFSDNIRKESNSLRKRSRLTRGYVNTLAETPLKVVSYYLQKKQNFSGDETSHILDGIIKNVEKTKNILTLSIVLMALAAVVMHLGHAF